MKKQRRFAEVAWTAEDVRTLVPRMSVKKAEDWLAANESHIIDRTVELGWDTLRSLLLYDGIRLKKGS